TRPAPLPPAMTVVRARARDRSARRRFQADAAARAAAPAAGCAATPPALLTNAGNRRAADRALARPATCRIRIPRAVRDRGPTAPPRDHRRDRTLRREA